MRKILLCLVLLLSFGSIGLVTHSQPVHAASGNCSVSWDNLSNCQGFFKGGYPGCAFNNSVCNGGNVLSGGINVNDAGSMEAVMAGYLNSPSYSDRLGAAFLIDTMLGYGPCAKPGGDAQCWAYAVNNFGTWQNLVNRYAASSNPGQYGIIWGYISPGETIDSQYFSDNADDSFHADYVNTIWSNKGKTVIYFYWNGGANHYEIEKDCGNLLGFSLPLANYSPPTGSISVTCDPATDQQVATISFSDPYGPTNAKVATGGWVSGPLGPGPVPIPTWATNPFISQPVYLYVQDVSPGGGGYVLVPPPALTNVPCVALSCGNMSTTPNRVDPYMHFSVKVDVTNTAGTPPPGGTMTLNITPPPGASYSFSGTQPAVSGPGDSSATFNNLGLTNKTGAYTVTWTLNLGPVSKTCMGTLRVVNLPYLSIYGGDALVGSSPDYNSGGSVCNANSSAGAFSWNNDNSNFAGAGAQYAVQAEAQIEDFASSQNATKPAPTSLSFANTYSPPDGTKLNPSAGLFGGNFGAAAADCDFTTDITSAPLTTNQTINATSVPTGTRQVIYVKGSDVFINGNIIYSSVGGWSSAGQIPFYELVVVGGNIYISGSVGELDGLYVAESSGGTGGIIYTCASSLGTPANPIAAGYYTTCHNQLVVNGAFVAKQIQLLRTNGSLGQAGPTDMATTSHASEVFNYTPELWLPRGGRSALGYTAITGLPPVL